MNRATKICIICILLTFAFGWFLVFEISVDANNKSVDTQNRIDSLEYRISNIEYFIEQKRDTIIINNYINVK